MIYLGLVIFMFKRKKKLFMYFDTYFYPSYRKTRILTKTRSNHSKNRLNGCLKFDFEGSEIKKGDIFKIFNFFR